MKYKPIKLISVILTIMFLWQNTLSDLAWVEPRTARQAKGGAIPTGVGMASPLSSSQDNNSLRPRAASETDRVPPLGTPPEIEALKSTIEKAMKNIHLTPAHLRLLVRLTNPNASSVAKVLKGVPLRKGQAEQIARLIQQSFARSREERPRDSDQGEGREAAIRKRWLDFWSDRERTSTFARGKYPPAVLDFVFASLRDFSSSGRIGNVVDLGCGNLEVSRRLRNEKANFGIDEIIALDYAIDPGSLPDREGITVARRRVEQTGLADNSSGAALLLFVAEYVHDRPPLMRELERILRPRGRAIIVTHHPNSSLMETKKVEVTFVSEAVEFLRFLQRSADRQMSQIEILQAFSPIYDSWYGTPIFKSFDNMLATLIKLAISLQEIDRNTEEGRQAVKNFKAAIDYGIQEDIESVLTTDSDLIDRVCNSGEFDSIDRVVSIFEKGGNFRLIRKAGDDGTIRNPNTNAIIGYGFVIENVGVGIAGIGSGGVSQGAAAVGVASQRLIAGQVLRPRAAAERGRVYLNGSSTIEVISRVAPDPNKPVLVLFDVHGTLLEPNWKRVCREAHLRITGRYPSEEWIREEITGKTTEQVIAALRSISPKPIETKRVMSIFDGTRRWIYRNEASPPIRGVIPFVQTLSSRHIPIGIVTRSPEEYAMPQLKKAGLLGYFPRENIIFTRPEDRRSFNRVRAIKSLGERYPDHTIVYFDDWTEAAGIEEFAIWFGVPQGEGEEFEANRRELINAGVHYILGGEYDWDILSRFLTTNHTSGAVSQGASAVGITGASQRLINSQVLRPRAAAQRDMSRLGADPRDARAERLRGRILQDIRDRRQARGGAVLAGEEAFREASRIVSEVIDRSRREGTFTSPYFSDVLDSPEGQQTILEFHLRDTAEKVRYFASDATVAVRIAALGHDLSRAFDDIFRRSSLTIDEDGRRIEPGSAEHFRRKYIVHSRASADLYCGFLEEANIDPQIIEQVRIYILYHEVGVKGYPAGGLMPIDSTSELYRAAEALKDADAVDLFGRLFPYALGRFGEGYMVKTTPARYAKMPPRVQGLADEEMSRLFGDRPDVYNVFLRIKALVSIQQRHIFTEDDIRGFAEHGLVVFGTHPDDIDIICAGLLLRVSGYDSSKIRVAVLATGAGPTGVEDQEAVGEDAKIALREKEQGDTVEIMGIPRANLKFFRFGSGGKNDRIPERLNEDWKRQVIEYLETSASQLRPDEPLTVIIGDDEADRQPWHTFWKKALLEIIQQVSNGTNRPVTVYAGAMAKGDSRVTHVLPLSGEFFERQKQKALGMHKSQENRQRRRQERQRREGQPVTPTEEEALRVLNGADEDERIHIGEGYVERFQVILVKPEGLEPISQGAISAIDSQVLRPWAFNDRSTMSSAAIDSDKILQDWLKGLKPIESALSKITVWDSWYLLRAVLSPSARDRDVVSLQGLQIIVKSALARPMPKTKKAAMEKTISRWLHRHVGQVIALCSFANELVPGKKKFADDAISCVGASYLYMELARGFGLDVGCIEVVFDGRGRPVEHVCNLIKYADKTFEFIDTYSDRPFAKHRRVRMRIDGEETSIDREDLSRYHSGQLQGLSLDSIHAIVISNLSNRYFEEGDLDRAEGSARAAIRLEPRSALAHFNLGVIYFHRAEQANIPAEEAIGHFQRAISLDAKYAKAFAWLGVACLQTRRYDDAMAYLQRAVELNPHDIETFCLLGEVYCATQQSDRAIGCLKRAIRLNPRSGELYHDLAEIYRSRGDRAAAKTYFRAAHKLNPSLAIPRLDGLPATDVDGNI